jgi:hypothetical protein
VRVSVLACRGSHCGNAVTHPDVDHPAQLAQFRAATALSHGTTRVVDCLGPCERANIVVVRHEDQRFWFGGVLSVELSDALAGWISAGATDPLPSLLDACVFTPVANPYGVLREVDLHSDELRAEVSRLGGAVSVRTGPPTITDLTRAFAWLATPDGDVCAGLLLADPVPLDATASRVPQLPPGPTLPPGFVLIGVVSVPPDWCGPLVD